MTSVARVNGADKRVINARTDVNQLVPFAHRWAWDKYLQACNNHWMPSEFPVVPSLWHEIGRKHKAILLDAMALYLTKANRDSNSVVLYRHITSPECREYLLRSAFEESLRLHTALYFVGRFNFDINALTEQTVWREITAAHLTLMDGHFATGSAVSDAYVVNAIATLLVAATGITGRLHFLVGSQYPKPVADIFARIERDSMLQAEFGLDLINQIKVEQPRTWTEDLKRQITSTLLQAGDLELARCAALDCPEHVGEIGKIVNSYASALLVDLPYPGVAVTPVARVAGSAYTHAASLDWGE